MEPTQPLKAKKIKTQQTINEIMTFSVSISKLLSKGVQGIRSNIKTISIHFIIWVLILLINFVFLKNYAINFDLTFHILIWVVYISLFYINYSFLIPVFLLRKKILVFIAGSLVLISGAYFINQTIAKNQFITVFRQNGGNQGGGAFAPDEFKPMPPNYKNPPPEFDRELLRRPDLEMRLRKNQPMGHGPDFGKKLFPLSGLLLLYFASISARVLIRFREDEQKRDEIIKERISTELVYLKQQINPHFLFNTLNNLYSLSIKNPELTPEAILKVSSILRYTLYKPDNSMAPLSEAIEIINAYIDIQKMRSKNNLPVTYNLTGETNDYKIEPFILLPLVENAFKYGMADINESFINIQITISLDKLKFIVENKKSFLAEPDPEHSGIGLKNIKRRLDLVYPDCHEFRIEDKDDIFSVYLELPLKTEKSDELYSN
jgi:two-component system, LytTR family, sensor kinase